MFVKRISSLGNIWETLLAFPGDLLGSKCDAESTLASAARGK